jgi:spermidine/putrescine transport system permease protein
MKSNQKILAYPYVVWLVIFIVVPLILVLYFSLSFRDGGLTLENYRRFMTPIYGKVLYRSLKLAFISTVFCLILGYPMAMIIARADISKRNLMVLLFVLPMWMNFLLRTYAWMTLLGKNGVINNVLGYFNLPTLNLLYNNGAVILGMIYNFIPFMVLQIYRQLFSC